jgi:hypothetical protein
MDRIDRLLSTVLVEGGRPGTSWLRLAPKPFDTYLVKDGSATTHEIGEGHGTGPVTVGRNSPGVISVDVLVDAGGSGDLPIQAAGIVRRVGRRG